MKRVALGGHDTRTEQSQNVDWKEVRSKFKLVLGQHIGPPDCPLMRRWFLETPLGSLRLHHFIKSDDERHLHDHPWPFATLVIAGSYDDYSYCPLCEGLGRITVLHAAHRSTVNCHRCLGKGKLVDHLRRGSFRIRPAKHRHAVRTTGAWTVIVTGPEERLWGFWMAPDVFRPMADYFRRYGYAPCE